MIFSSKNNLNSEEIRQYISVSRSLSFETISTPLQIAYETYITTLLGEPLCERLENIYNSTTRSKTEEQFLRLCQKATANLALWNSFMELQFLISDGGFHRDESDRLHSLYKYQEQELKEGWKEKGFNALDELLDFLTEKITDFQEYKQSKSYINGKRDLIRSTDEINRYYFINNSRLIFLRLLPQIRIVEDTVISSRIGDVVYEELIGELQKDSVEKRFEKLRELLVPVVALYAVGRLIKQTGSITDRGLFFETTEANYDKITTSQAQKDILLMQCEEAEKDAEMYWIKAEKYLIKEFEYKKANGGYIKYSRRDNENKRSFWI